MKIMLVDFGNKLGNVRIFKNKTRRVKILRNIKLFFSSLTVVFGILGLTKVLSSSVAMPIMFVCMAITMFITSKEYKDNKQKRSALYFLLLGIFLLIVTIYNTASMIWRI